MTRRFHILASPASALVALWFATDAAVACACCTNRGGRYVAVETLSPNRLDMIEQMSFAEEAFVAQGAAGSPSTAH